MNFVIENGTSTGGAFFKPKEHVSAAVILFEPKRTRNDVPTNYGPKTYTDSDITIFLSVDELKAKSPSTVMENSPVSGNLAKTLENYVGKATVGKLGQRDTGKGNPAWTIDAVDPKLIPLVVEYVEDREKKKAEDVPSFLS